MLVVLKEDVDTGSSVTPGAVAEDAGAYRAGRFVDGAGFGNLAETSAVFVSDEDVVRLHERIQVRDVALADVAFRVFHAESSSVAVNKHGDDFKLTAVAGCVCHLKASLADGLFGDFRRRDVRVVCQRSQQFREVGQLLVRCRRTHIRNFIRNFLAVRVG